MTDGMTRDRLLISRTFGESSLLNLHGFLADGEYSVVPNTAMRRNRGCLAALHAEKVDFKSFHAIAWTRGAASKGSSTYKVLKECGLDVDKPYNRGRRLRFYKGQVSEDFAGFLEERSKEAYDTLIARGFVFDPTWWKVTKSNYTHRLRTSWYHPRSDRYYVTAPNSAAMNIQLDKDKGENGDNQFGIVSNACTYFGYAKGIETNNMDIPSLGVATRWTEKDEYE
jgi:hypothetical protein